MDLTLEALTSGEIAVWGLVKAGWQGECRRCLQSVTGQLEVKVKELFERKPGRVKLTYSQKTEFILGTCCGKRCC